MLPHVRCKVAGVFIHQLLSVFDWWTLLVCEDGHLTQPLPANPMLEPSIHQQQSPKQSTSIICCESHWSEYIGMMGTQKILLGH